MGPDSWHGIRAVTRQRQKTRALKSPEELYLWIKLMEKEVVVETTVQTSIITATKKKNSHWLLVTCCIIRLLFELFRVKFAPKYFIIFIIICFIPLYILIYFTYEVINLFWTQTYDYKCKTCIFCTPQICWLLIFHRAFTVFNSAISLGSLHPCVLHNFVFSVYCYPLFFLFI